MFIFQKNFENLAHDLTHPEDYQLQMTIQAILRDYQEIGVKWFMLNYYIGGILADDMGLGKPCATIWPVLQKKKLKIDSSLSSLIYATGNKNFQICSMEVAVAYIAPSNIAMNSLQPILR